jgi:hypothetical protein
MRRAAGGDRIYSGARCNLTQPRHDEACGRQQGGGIRCIMVQGAARRPGNEEARGGQLGGIGVLWRKAQLGDWM